MTAPKTRTWSSISWLASVGAFLSTGCATIKESVRNEDRPVRTYNEQSKTPRWTYRVAVVGWKTSELRGAPTDAVPVSVAVARYRPCERREHAVVDRTKVTERVWDASAANSRTTLYFWGAVGVLASVAGGVYVVATDDKNKAGGIALIGGGSLASAAMPLGNELRAIDSREHVGVVDEVKTTEAGECDGEPARDARVQLRGSDGQSVAEIATDSSGRAQTRVAVRTLLSLGAGSDLSIEVSGEAAGTTTALGPVSGALTTDDRAWKGARGDACAAPKTEGDCDAVHEYLKAHPTGMHAADAKRVIEAATPEITKLRRTREIEAALSERQEDKAGISISKVRVRTDDPAFGGRSSERYVEIKVDATARRKQSGGVDVWARTACQVGDKRMVDEQSALDNLASLNAGETKEIEFAPFINRPLSRDPTMCEIYFGTELIGSGGVAVRRYCYVPRAGVRSGPCSWPSP